MLMTWFSFADISVFEKKILWCLPPVFSAAGVHPEFYSCHKFVFSVSNLMWWFGKKKKLSEQRIIPLEAERSARQAKCLASGDEGKKLLLLLFLLRSEISKRHSINYSPSLRQSDILIMTGGGCRASVWAQTRHDRVQTLNMFAAKKYRPVWCVRRPRGIRVNGNNSYGENTAYLLSHYPGKKGQGNY